MPHSDKDSPLSGMPLSAQARIVFAGHEQLPDPHDVGTMTDAEIEQLSRGMAEHIESLRDPEERVGSMTGLLMAAIKASARSHTDDLTGLFTKSYFEQRVQKALSSIQAQVENQHHRESTHSFTIAYLDLAGLNTTNNRLGHEAGNMLLNKMSSFLRNHFRDQDIIARLCGPNGGADEFGVLVWNVDAENLEHRLRAGLLQPDMFISVPGYQTKIPVRASVGVVNVTTQNVHQFKDAPAVIAIADLRMNQDKAARPVRRSATLEELIMAYSHDKAEMSNPAAQP
jgi:diguanylate cyclase (GGDEF)-like protein